MPNIRNIAEIGHQVERRHRRLVGPTDGVQRTRDAEVVDVVAGRVRQGPGLAPAGHAAVHQAGIRVQADVRTQTQPLHHPGTEPFDQHVRTGQHATHGCETFGLAQVQRGGALVAPVHVGWVGLRRAPIHRDDVGAQVGQQLAGQRRGPDAAELDDTQRCQRAAHLMSLITVHASNDFD
jgi:hypothetical protein